MRALQNLTSRFSTDSVPSRLARIGASKDPVGKFRGHSTVQPKAPQFTRPAEEETLPHYDPDQFYPVHIGDVFNENYRILGKLGYGANSTIWLSRDISRNDYVALKFYVRGTTRSMNREVQAYERLRSVNSGHPGRACIRELLDSFEVTRSNGSRHFCLVHQPLQISIWDFQHLGPSFTALPVDMVKGVLRYMLCALDFLHTDADITHCDLKLGNIMLSIEDESVLKDFEDTEYRDPCPRKVIDKDRTIYLSRNLRGPKNHAWGYPVLCDFGEARIGGSYAYEEIQPEVYKAPEIIMQTNWTHKVDIWNIALVAWDMMESSEHLFDARDVEGFHNNRHHIAEMIGYLGLPPKEFLLRSSNSPRLFDEEGNWKGQPPVTMRSLEDSEKNLDAADRSAFVSFVRSMLSWLPEERKSAAALLEDKWLK